MGLYTLFIIYLILHHQPTESQGITNNGRGVSQSGEDAPGRAGRYIGGGNRPPDWEAGLREATTQALLREERRIPRLREILQIAPLVGRQDIATPFGDIAIIARGQLYSAPGGFQFVQEPYQNDCIGCHSQRSICDHEPCAPWRPRGREKLLALWTVKRIRHRDQRYGHRYELEYTVSPISGSIRDAYVTRNGRFDYSLPGHVFLVKANPNVPNVPNYPEPSKGQQDNRREQWNTQYSPNYVALNNGEIYLPGRHDTLRPPPPPSSVPGYKPGYIIALTPNGYKHIIRPYPVNRYDTTRRPLYHQHHHYYTEGTQNNYNTQAPDYYKEIINSILHQAPNGNNPNPNPSHQYIPPNSNEIPSPIRPPSGGVMPPPLPSTQQTSYGSEQTTHELPQTYPDLQTTEQTTPTGPQSYYPTYSTQQTTQKITTASAPPPPTEPTKPVPPPFSTQQEAGNKPTILTFNEVTGSFVPSMMPTQPETQKPFIPSTSSVQLTYQPSTPVATKPTYSTSTKPIPPSTMIAPPKPPQTTASTFMPSTQTTPQQTTTIQTTKPSYVASSSTQSQTTTLLTKPTQQTTSTATASSTSTTTKSPSTKPPTTATTPKRPSTRPPDTRPFRPGKPGGMPSTPGKEPDDSKDDFADDLFGKGEDKPSSTPKSTTTTTAATELDEDDLGDIAMQVNNRPGNKKPAKKPSKRPPGAPRPMVSRPGRPPGRPGKKPGGPPDEKEEPEFDVDIFGGGGGDKMDSQMMQSMQVLPAENLGANDIFSAAVSKPLVNQHADVDVFGGGGGTTQFPNQLSSEKFTQFTQAANQGADEIFSATLNVQPNKSSSVEVFPTKYPEDKISQSTQIHPVVNPAAEEVFNAELLPPQNHHSTEEVFPGQAAITKPSPTVPTRVNQGSEELFSATIGMQPSKENVGDVFGGDQSSTKRPTTIPMIPVTNFGSDELFSASTTQATNRNKTEEVFHEDRTSVRPISSTPSAKPTNQGSEEVFSASVGPLVNRDNQEDIFATKIPSTRPTKQTTIPMTKPTTTEDEDSSFANADHEHSESTSPMQPLPTTATTTTAKRPSTKLTKKPPSAQETEDVFAASPTPESNTNNNPIFEEVQTLKPTKPTAQTSKPVNQGSEELFTASLTTSKKNQSENIFGDERPVTSARPKPTSTVPKENQEADALFSATLGSTTDGHKNREVFENTPASIKKPKPTRPTENQEADALFSATLGSTTDRNQNREVFESKPSTAKKPKPTRPTGNFEADELFGASLSPVPVNSGDTDDDIFGSDQRRKPVRNKKPGKQQQMSASMKMHAGDELFGASVGTTPSTEEIEDVFGGGRGGNKGAHSSEDEGVDSSKANQEDSRGDSKEKTNGKKKGGRRNKNGKGKYSGSKRRSKSNKSQSPLPDGKTVIFSNFYESSTQPSREMETTDQVPTQQSYSTSITFEVNKTTREYSPTTERYSNGSKRKSKSYKGNSRESKEQTPAPGELSPAGVKHELDKLALSLVNHARSIEYLNKQQLLKAKYKRRNLYNSKSRRVKSRTTASPEK